MQKYKHLFIRLKNNSYQAVFILVILYPSLLLLINILNGSLPFWYDPARDLLLAQDNLKKPTLIGPPTGIPGVFYGPYWIWIISLGLVFSKDPRFITFLINFLPYLTIFPYILYKLTPLLSKKIVIILWLLFIFAFRRYTNFLWNPHLAPLLFLILIYLLNSLSIKNRNVHNRTLIKAFSTGIVSGLLLNFHISFGLGILIATLIYLLYLSANSLLKITNNKQKLFKPFLYHLSIQFLFILGIFFTLLPYILFETRHDFLQSRALIKVISNSYLYNSASVGQTGLNTIDILHHFFIKPPSEMFLIKPAYIPAIYIIIILFIIYRFSKKRISFTENEKKILIYLTTCTLVLLTLFISSKNPVWEYHFVGVEIILMLSVGLVIKKWGLLNKLCLIITVFVVLTNFLNFLTSYSHANPLSIPSLASKRYIVEKIYSDSQNQPFSVFIYSPSIYTYDFDYLFNWLGETRHQQLPQKDLQKAQFIYLIIPPTSTSVKQDFINWKTPREKYTTVANWIVPDGTEIVKRTPAEN